MKTDGCIGCGKCTSSCEFLNKYGINLKDLEGNSETLYYECFLCGECSRVCPVNIDGRELVLGLRRDISAAGRLKRGAYLSIIAEKNNYLFRNYSVGKSTTALFPGCNFPSFFPNTTLKLINMLKEKTGAGVIFDCCGKPIAELGMEKEERLIIDKINKRLKDAGVKELVTVCPNCYYFLKGKLDVDIIDIYEKLNETGYEPELNKAEYNVFIPCPDRDSMRIFENIKKLLNTDSTFNFIKDVQCCGLGGLAACVNKKGSEKLIMKMKDKNLSNIFTYCATCCGNFIRNGLDNSEHFLLHLLKTSEEFPRGMSSVLNRAKYKFKRL